MKLTILISLLALPGCPAQKARTAGPYEMNCQITDGYRLSRCENQETVCYKYTSGGLHCKWKETE